jgi:hypothetical protein
MTVNDLIDRAAVIFRTRRDARQQLLRRRAVEVFGPVEANKWLTQPGGTGPALETVEENWQFEANIKLLDEAQRQSKAERKPKSGNIRAWRAG